MRSLKFGFLVVSSLLIGQMSFAKDKKIMKGNFKSGTFFSLDRTLSSEQPNSPETLNVRLRLDFDYFIFDKFAIGPAFSYQRIEDTSRVIEGTGFGFDSSYYFSETENWASLVGFSFLVNTFNEEKIFSPYIGTQYFATESVSFGPQLIYTNVSSGTRSSRDEIRLFVGFYFYL